MEEQRGELKRVLKLKDLAIYGIAFMTPIAPAYIYGNASAVTGGTLAMAYVVAMIAMLFTATSYGSMAGAFPVLHILIHREGLIRIWVSLLDGRFILTMFWFR